MLGSALHVVENIPPLEKYDGIIVTDLFNLADFKALVGSPCPPILAYFHENQMTYPQPPGDKGVFHLGIINITTAMVPPMQRPIQREMLPPCNTACPVGNDVEGFVTLMQNQKWDDALELLSTTNPLPGVTGRVCHSPCERSCNRGRFDQSVSIKALERALADYAAKKRRGASTFSPKHKEKVAIIGSGPAGLSCAYHLTRNGFRVTVFDEKAEIGGVLRYGIPSYRIPRDVLDREVEFIQKLGIDFKLNRKLGADLSMTDLENYDAMYMAIGFHRTKALGVPGEDCPQVISGLAFLEQVNAGKSPELGRHVLIVGGGNAAVHAARSALR